jgi:ATP-dependent exoDNAse (exonuclease V) beta subunit
LYLTPNPNWFPKKNIFDTIKELFYLYNIFSLNFEKNKYSEIDIIKLRKNIFKLLKNFYTNLPKDTNKKFSNSIKNFLEKQNNNLDFSKLPSQFQKEDFPINKNATVSKKIFSLWKKIKKKLSLLYEIESVSTYNTYIEIFENLLPQLYSLAQKKDVLFLEELNKYAKILFTQQQVSVPELYLRLATQIKHYLIDEFQDTSSLQWQNLYPLISESISSGGTLFYVGDKKQSIFRFRGGEVNLFDEVKKMFSNYVIEETFLTNNYRSAEIIVNFNNILFSQENIFKTVEEIYTTTFKNLSTNVIKDINEIVSFYSRAQQSFKPKKSIGYLKIEFISENNDTESDTIIKEKLLKIILDLKSRNCPLNNIAILTRRNSEVELVTQWLLEENIPVSSEKTLDIRTNSIIKEIVAFLRFLNSPSDNISFTTFVLGEIFLKKTQLEFDKIQDFIFSTMTKNISQKNCLLYKEFQTEFPFLWEKYFSNFFNKISFLSVYDIVLNIISQFDVLSNFSSDQGFIMHLLEVIHNKQQDYHTISSFLEYFDSEGLEEFYVPTSNTDAINVLTIHKSKGLEFEVVIIPFFELTINPGFSDKKFFLDFSSNNIKLLYIKKSYLPYSEKLTQIYLKEYKKSFIDNLNNLYVGCTRAKNELYILVPPKSGNENNKAKIFLSKITNNSDYEQGEKLVFENKLQQTNILQILPEKPCTDFEFIEEDFVTLEQFHNRKKILTGIVLHHIFSLIGNLYNQNVEDVLNQVFNKIKLFYPTISNWEEIEKTTKKILSNKILKKYFYIENALVEQEKEVVTKTGDIKRIDRIIYTKDKIDIVEFKSSKDNFELYKKQVLEYVSIIKDLFPQKIVFGNIIYFDTAKVDIL